MSKDLTTFSTLTTLSKYTPVDEPTNVDPNFLPRDDQSIANHIAAQYRAAGIDPASAYDTTDDALNDFGGPKAFI